MLSKEVLLRSTPVDKGSPFRQLVERTITKVDSNATSVEPDAFRYCLALTSINLPEVTFIDRYTFYHCPSLTSINLPKVTDINFYAFQTLEPDNPCTVTLGISSTDSKASSVPWSNSSYNVTFVFTDGKKYTYGTGLHD